MVQVKIYGLKANINSNRAVLSATIQRVLGEAIGTPLEKKFQRFIVLDSENFIYPDDRTANYTIIEVLMFAGRTPETKKNLIRLLYQHLEAEVKIAPQDLEITLIEIPSANWGIRGLPGDELKLNYKIDV